jgi:hypothetical protein
MKKRHVLFLIIIAALAIYGASDLLMQFMQKLYD